MTRIRPFTTTMTRTMATKTLGVVIGRFQTPTLTPGHQQLIQSAIAQSDELLVLIGSAQTQNTKRNPLPADYRIDRMRGFIAGCGQKAVLVMGVDDHPDDRVWLARVHEVIGHIQEWTKCEHYSIFVSEDSGAEKFFNPSTVQKVFAHPSGHAADVRQMIGKKDSGEWSETFAQGVVWATQNRYPQVFPTVDVALIRPEDKKLLLGKKSGEPLWRFPGGFVDPKDDSFLSAAKRELKEEVGLVETSDWKQLGSLKIQDSRIKNETDQSIITTVFACYYVFGPVIASDDLQQVQWADWTIDPMELMPEHRPILAMLRGH